MARAVRSESKTGPVYAPPSSAHWLGTDDGGVDMLSLIIAGSRVSLGVGFLAALVAILIGGTVGICRASSAAPPTRS